MMNRLFRGMRENKFLIILLCLWILISGSILLAYENEWEFAMQQPRSIVEQGDLDDRTISGRVNLYEGNKITQEIIAISGEITGIGVLVDAEKENISGNLHVQLENSMNGEVYQEWNYELVERKSKSYFGFILDTPIWVSEKDKLQFEIWTEDTGKEAPEVPMAELRKGEEPCVIEGEAIPEGVIPTKVYSGTYENLKYFVLFLYILITILFGVVALVVLRKLNLQVTFVAVTLVLGIMYMFVVPPFVAPDEASHFVTAYMESSKLLGEPDVDQDGNILLPSDALWGYKTEQRIASRDTYLQYFEGALGNSRDRMETIGSRTPLKTSNPGYFPQVVGITIARGLHMNNEQLLLFGRLFALGWYCLVMYWAIKLMPVKKMILFLVGILPMTMQQIVSYNYDSVLFGVCFFAISYMIYLVYVDRKVYWYDGAILIGIAVIIASIKLVYLPIFAIALLIPKEKFGNSRKKIGYGFLIMLSSGLTIILSQLAMLQSMAGEGVAATGPGEKISFGYCLNHPVQVVAMFYRTIERQSSRFLNEMIASPLGWLEMHLPGILIIGFVIILLISVLRCEKDRKDIVLSISFRVYTIIGILLVVIGVMAALFFSWTTVGNGEIEGIQGRYFLPILPLVLLCMQNETIVLKKNIDKYLLLGATYLHCLVVFFATLTAITR